MSTKPRTAKQVARIMDKLDLGFVEAAHYERDWNCQPMSQGQRPIDGTTSNVAHYASSVVPMLAYPTLYCMGHAVEHGCAFTHKIDDSLGVCDITLVRDTLKYVASERVPVTATITSSGYVASTEA